MNVADIHYHGVRDQIRRVISKMTPEQLDAGMTAFQNGSSSWANCFFARAFGGQTEAVDSPEKFLMEQLDLSTPVPIRIVYCTFDGLGKTMTRAQLADFIRSVREGENLDQTLAVVKSIDYTGVESREVATVCG